MQIKSLRQRNKSLEENKNHDEYFLKLLRSRVVGIQSFWRTDRQVRAKINMSSGIMLSNELILTSAHNIFVNDFGCIASDIRIIFLDDEHNIITESNISLLMKPRLHENVQFLFKQKQEKEIDLDLAVIRLKKIEKIPNQLIIWPFNQQLILKQKAIVCGLPDLKAAQNMTLKNQNENDSITELRIDVGKISKFKQNYMYYQQIDTVIGQSGGPIFICHKQQLYLAGIHAQYNEKSRTGKGIKISNKIVEQIQKWQKSLKVGLRKQANSDFSTIYPSTHYSFSEVVDQDYFDQQFYQKHLFQFNTYFHLIEIDTKD